MIAESNPGLDGHKLAASLCKTPSIGVTLIPDSNIYAMMARVNKARVHTHFYLFLFTFTYYLLLITY